MEGLTENGTHLVNDIAARYNLSRESVFHMLVAVNRGGGTMAQFSIPELGSGQWMQGGMTMVGDMFNHGLQATVDNLCGELSRALASTQIFLPPTPGQLSGNSWWPVELGAPSSSGGQNNTRYAIFPQSRRLAVDIDGRVTIYDTLDHQIGGVSQQQGGDTSLTFSSQYGTVAVSSLPRVSGPGATAEAPVNFAAPPSPAPPESLPASSPDTESPAPDAPGGNDAPAASASAGEDRLGPEEMTQLLTRLKELFDAGILTEEEYSRKKGEVLARV